MPTYIESPEHKAMRSATANTLRRLAELVENGDSAIEKINFDTIFEHPRTLNMKTVPELSKIIYMLEVVTWGMGRIDEPAGVTP